MTVAGGEENSGLRVGPYVPDSGAEPEVIAEADVEAVEPEPADADLADTPAEDIAVPAPSPTTALVRPGPFVLEADSWEAQPDTDSKNEAYHGRRRAEAPAARLWIAITVVLVGLGAAVAVPLALMGSPGRDGVAAPSTPAGAGVVAVSDSTTSVLPTPSPVPTVTVRSPSPSLAKTKTKAAPPPPRRTSSPTTSPPPPHFESVSYEAEAADADPEGITGSAWVWGYPGASGGSIVRNIGNWGSEPGVLRISGVMIPSSGTYVITIHYVHPDNEANRTALVSVSGIAPMEVAFAGSNQCCHTTAITVTLAAGAHTVTITNATNRAPSIDKIVLSRP